MHKHLLTPDTLKAAYTFLESTPPFAGWNLPDPDEIKFTVSRDRTLQGHHTMWGRRPRKKHLISISIACVTNTTGLVEVMAHEMIHLHMGETGMHRHGREHGQAFRILANKVCKFHGFDPRTF